MLGRFRINWLERFRFNRLERTERLNNLRNLIKLNKRKLSNLTLIPLFAIMIAAGAWITVPAAIPFTMQTFCIFLTLYILGGANGTKAILLYLLLGAIGLPVFSGFKAGLSVLAGPTGGYLIGFIFIGLSYRLGEKIFLRSVSGNGAGRLSGTGSCDDDTGRGSSDASGNGASRMSERRGKFLFLILGLCICYAFGTGWFVYISNSSSSSVSVLQALSLCVLPYIIPDLIKLLLASKLSAKLAPKLNNFL